MRWADAASNAVAACLLGLPVALFCGCTSRNSTPSHPSAAPAPGPPPVSYDWQPLLPAPLGTWFKDMPVPLAEVIEFHETGESGRGEECFKPAQAPPPRFLGRVPDDYVLCFVRDRLSRIEAGVRVPADGAAALFAAACSAWLHGGARGPTAAQSCEGRTPDVAFAARLVAAGTDATAPATATISIDLTPPADPARSADPARPSDPASP